jgi:ACS family hexuronate transporter-like MFS transporter
MNATAGAEAPVLPKPSGKVRWIVCGLLFAAVVLSYIDRLVLSVLKPDLAAQYHWTEAGYADLAVAFQLTYGVAYVIFGRLVDRVGAKIGYAIAVTLWTIGHVSHIFFTTTTGMMIARLTLAFGEAGTFPSALAAANEWFPKRERAFAIGIFNAGSNIGAIVTPLLVPIITIAFGWRWAFILTGLLTVVWLAAWLGFYNRPSKHPRVSPEELAFIESDPAQPEQVRVKRGFVDGTVALFQDYRALFRHRQTWAYMAGRFLIDPVWWTFLFWLPDFFNKQYNVKMLEFGPPLVMIYLIADVGSVAGGWISSRLIGKGYSVNRSRKTAMFFMALFALPIAFATAAPNMWVAAGLIGLACAAHQGFSANVYTIPGDLFPRWRAGSVIGLGGLAGAIGGALMAKYAGYILATVGSFQPIFILAACSYLLALLVVHLIVPRWEPAVLAHNEGNQ